MSMGRDSHDAALHDIAIGMERFSYILADAFISEWVNRATAGAVTGVLAGSGSGALTRSPIGTVIGAGVGYVAGTIAGTFVHQEVARYYSFGGSPRTSGATS